MASEIKVDTISEKTSAGGVTIDGLLIKDGGISGDVSLIGTTPTFTIGDAGAEDATLLFDGNAQDFHIGLDDSADDLVIGVGSALGTTTAIAIDENANSTFSGTVTVGVDDTGKDVKLFGATSGKYWLWDESADGVVAVSNLQQTGTITVGVDDTGHDVKFFGATASSYMLWDESADDLNLIASGLGVVSAKDLGSGLHIRTADSGASVNANADELVIEGSGHSGLTILSATDAEGRVSFGDSGDNDIGHIMYNHSNNYMTFFTNATEQLRIDDDGSILSENMSDTNGHQFYGTWTSGNNTLFNWIDGSGNTCGTIGMDAGNNTSSYNTSSDYRLKNNVEDLTGAIDRVKELKPKRFNWISNPDGDKFDGFIAHEVSSVIPEAIHGEKDAIHSEVLYTDKDELPEGKEIGDVKEAEKIKPQGIDQSKLVPLLVASLQEAITKIETLETKVTVLENA